MNENQVTDDPAVAANDGAPVEASEAMEGRETVPAAHTDAGEVGNQETTPPTEASGVSEVIAPPADTIVSNRLSIERAQSVPIDEPDGMTLRTAYVIQGFQGVGNPDKPITALMTTAKRINHDGRLDMLVGLLTRLRAHKKSYEPTMMAEAIGDVAVGDELERFAREGIELGELVELCTEALPAVNAMPSLP